MSSDDAGAAPGIIDSNTLKILTKAEIDQQIATAKAYPRTISMFRKRALELVTLNEQIAQSCIYTLRRKERDGGSKVIQGGSIRFAEIIATAWGNIRRGARIVNEGDRFITAQGVCHDLETNQFVSLEVQRRITNREGRRYGDDMIGVTGNAATSIAMRNAVLSCVPQAVWAEMLSAARKVVAGDVETLPKRRDSAIAEFAAFGVTEAVVLKALGRASVRDVTIDDLATLHGMLTALRDGEGRVEEMFGDDDAPAKPAARAEPKAKPKDTETRKPAAEKQPAADVGEEPPPAADPGQATMPLSEDEEREATSRAFGDTSKSPPPKVAVKNGEEPITAGGLATMRRQIQICGINETAVCQQFKVANVELITKSAFAEVMNWIQAQKK